MTDNVVPMPQRRTVTLHPNSRANLAQGPGAGQCDICHRRTGNLAKHRKSCARKHGRIPSATPLSASEEALILRAGTHAVHPSLLPPEARLTGGVEDIHVARLVRMIEKGTEIVPSSTGRTWYVVGPAPIYQKPSLTRVVLESLRLGITWQRTEFSAPRIVKTTLQVAHVHARRADEPNLPACGSIHPGILRWRLLDRDLLEFVDCSACLDVPLSCIAGAR